MPRQTRLMRRNGRFYVNAKVPRDVVHLVGKRLIRYSLGTADYREALAKLSIESAKIDASFAAARRKLREHPATDLTPTEVEQMALLWFAGLDRRVREDEVSAVPGMSRDEALEQVQIDTAILSDPDHPDAMAAAQAEARRLMESNNVALPEGSPAHRLLVDLVRRGMLETTRRGADRLAGDYNGRAHDEAFDRSPGTPTREHGESVSQVRDRWLAENEPRWAPSTRREFRQAIRMFIEAVGDVPVREVTRADVRRFKDLLVQAPVGFSRGNRKLTLPRAVERAAGDPGARRLAPPTINKLLTAVSGMLRWARDNGFRDDNPAERMKVALGTRPDRQRMPFEVADLKLLFGADIYRQGRWPERRAERYWLPLLGAFTGARLEELAQLHVTDVRRVEGVWCISINADGDDKRLKAMSSVRDVPLHSTIIDAGFLDYVDEVRAAGHTRLFPDMRREPKRESWSHAYSKWFGRWKRDLGVRDGATFHSFRHAVAQAMRDAGVDLETRNAVLGHAQQAMGSRYGSGVRVRQLRRAVEKIVYGVDLVPILSSIEAREPTAKHGKAAKTSVRGDRRQP